jgi:hypothetical protein
MFGWSFAARTVDELARLLRALGKHRYLMDTDLRLHWSVDAALADRESFFEHAMAFNQRRAEQPELELGSRDPALWRPASVDQVIEALGCFWDPELGPDAGLRLQAALRTEGVAAADHEPFGSDADEVPHPELVLLDWVLLPVDQLDTERHAGALRAMEVAEEEVNPSEPIYVEGPTIAEPELLAGAPRGVLPDDLVWWADGAYSYCDYVFRGVARSAKLLDPPEGYNDI